MRPEPGTILQDRYRILRKLGDGGMGTVYEGEHLLIKRRVAIKILHGQLAEKPEVVARFLREAQAATSIGHPNIIEVTDFGSLPDNSPFMVLEFLEGRDWSADLAKQGPQPLGKVAHIITQVCRALSVAHAKGIVHRDIKPENIFLLERNGDPNFAKVLDFGISKMKSPDGEGTPQNLTRTGAAMGTPYYMSPEQCSGRRDIDHRSDIYSLGVVLFQALTGQYPFDDHTYPMLVLKICTQVAPEITHWRTDLPSGVVELIRAMLEKDPRLRPQNCAEIEVALRSYVSSSAGVALVQGAPATAAITAQGNPAALIAGRHATVALGGVTDAPRTPAEIAPPSDGAVVAPTGATRLPWPLLIAAGVLLVIAGIGGTAIGLSASADDEPSPRAERISIDDHPVVEASEPSTDATGGVEVVDRPIAEEVRVPVSIGVEPPEAAILLDGVPITNPFDGDLVASSTVRHLTFSADGYHTIERDFTTMDPQRIRVELQRVEPEPARPSGTSLRPTRRPEPLVARPQQTPPTAVPVGLSRPTGSGGRQPIRDSPF